jgi:hypothetical protein
MSWLLCFISSRYFCLAVTNFERLIISQIIVFSDNYHNDKFDIDIGLYNLIFKIIYHEKNCIGYVWLFYFIL